MINSFAPLPPLILFCFDLMFYSCWFCAIFGMVHKLARVSLPRWMSRFCGGLIVLISLLACLDYLLLSTPDTIYASPPIAWSNLILAICGVALIEQLYRNVSPFTQHAIKFFALGVGGLLVYEVCLFSQILVFQSVPAAGWNARGAIYGIGGVFLSITLSKQDTPHHISLSRNIVFYSTSLLGAGLFLFAMAGAGYYAKHYGEPWGAALQQVITFTAILGLIIASTVPSLRTWAQVFISKHFFRHKYDYRKEWLKLIDILSRPIEQTDPHQRAIKAMTRIFQCPGGTLWLHNNKRYEPYAAQNMKIPEAAVEPEGSSFISLMTKKQWVFEASERRFPEDRTLPFWADRIDGLWIIAPLINENELIGFMGLLKNRSTASLTWEDLDLLKTVGRQLGGYIARHQAAEQLAQSRQLDAYNKLTAFIMHDLKNLIAQQALVVENAAKHKGNPAFIEDAINTIDNSVQRMNNLLNKMQRKAHPPSKLVDLEKALSEAVSKCRDIEPTPLLHKSGENLYTRADPDTLIMIFCHLIRNAQESTTDQGSVVVRLSKKNGRASVEIEDNGTGMTRAFIKKRLFAPFDTTKSDQGMGIGALQAQEYVLFLGGDLSVASTPSVGTTFFIILPLSAAVAAS